MRDRGDLGCREGSEKNFSFFRVGYEAVRVGELIILGMGLDKGGFEDASLHSQTTGKEGKRRRCLVLTT